MSFSRPAQWFTVFGLLLGGLIAQPEGRLPVSHSSKLDEFTGAYTLVREQSEDPRKAIDRAVGEMSFFARPVARRQLRQKTALYDSFSLQKQGDFLHTRLPSESILSLPLSGSVVLWRASDGEQVRVHLQPGPELVQVFETKQGKRENRFVLSSDRHLLTIDVKLTSRQLPEPVEYRVVYRRA